MLKYDVAHLPTYRKLLATESVPHDDSHTPSVRYEGKHSFSVMRYGSAGFLAYWDSFKPYRWIAEGVPMQEE